MQCPLLKALSEMSVHSSLVTTASNPPLIVAGFIRRICIVFLCFNAKMFTDNWYMCNVDIYMCLVGVLL